MTIDLLDYMMPPEWFRKNVHLVSREHPKYAIPKQNWLWQVKSDSGYPWDGNFVGNEHIYQNVTEWGWNNPKSYKQFASKSWPKGHGGIAWAPRYLDTEMVTLPLVTEDSSYQIFEDGKLIDTKNLGGPVVCHVEGPVSLKAGELGRQDCVVQYFQWNPGFEFMEVNLFARGLGWCNWALFKRENGAYKLQQETKFEYVAQGGAPELVWPNPLP
jgi:hypothetical protein